MTTKFERLNKIREPDLETPLAASILSSVLVAVFGIVIGVISQTIGYFTENSTVWWQDIVKDLEFNLVFHKFPIWFMLGLTVAVCSQRPLKAAINELVFFIGVIVGFNIVPIIFKDAPKPENLMTWVLIAAVSVPLAMIFWYSKSGSWPSILFDALIIGVLAAYCFDCGLVYFHFTDMIMDLFNAVIIALVAIALATGIIQFVVSLLGGIIIALVLGPVIQMS